MSVQNYGIAGDANVTSPEIWKDCPMGAIIKDPSRYLHIWEDFVCGVITNDTKPSFFNLVGTGADIAVIDDQLAGVVVLSGSGTNDDSSQLKSNVLYDLTMNNSKRFWFEVRLKSVLIDVQHAVIAGLMEPTGCVATGIDDEGAEIIDEDFIGFFAACDTNNVQPIQTIYQNGGDGAHTDVETEVHTLAADTYVRLGMRFDGKKTVTFYVNGVATGTKLNIDDLTDNSLANPLCIFVGMKDTAEGTFSATVEIDWIRFACEKIASGY